MSYPKTLETILLRRRARLEARVAELEAQLERAVVAIENAYDLLHYGDREEDPATWRPKANAACDAFDVVIEAARGVKP